MDGGEAGAAKEGELSERLLGEVSPSCSQVCSLCSALARPPPPALCALILGRDSLFAFSGCVCAGDSAASGTRRCLTLWHGAQGLFVGALCARGDVGRPAFNVCWCFPGADHLVLGGGVGSDSVLGG
jgi:hypothetical protein